MSRTVSKILAIIAMVFVIPLMIVGTAFVAFYSTDKTINVAAIVDEVAAGTVEKPKIEYKEKLDTSHKITTGQNGEVKVSAQLTTVAYVFQGWFAGSEQEYRAAVETNGVEAIEWVGGKGALTLSVNMQEAAENYVAVYNVVRYNIAGWEYKLNPEQDAVTTTAPAGAKTQYKYGEALPTAEDLTPKYDGNKYVFGGWQIKGAEGETARYTTAEFDGVESGASITLTDPWQRYEVAHVKFFDEEGNELAGLSENVHIGDTLDVDKKLEEIDRESGYTYYWYTTENGKVTSVTPTDEKDIELHLHKDVIEYTANVTDTADASFSGAKTVTFTVEEYDSLNDLFDASKWTIKNNTFWKFKGLTWNGAQAVELGSAAAFKTAFITANPTATATAQVSAVIAKNYETFSVDTFEYRVCEEGTQLPIADLKQHISAGDVNVVRPAGDKTDEYLFEDMFGLDNIANGTWYANISGVSGNVQKVKLTGVEITINGHTLRATFADPDSRRGTSLLGLIGLLESVEKDETGIYAAIASEDVSELHIDKISCIYEVLPVEA